MKILIKNGHLVDPANKKEGVFDVLLANGKVIKVSKEIKESGAEIIDAALLKKVPSGALKLRVSKIAKKLPLHY